MAMHVIPVINVARALYINSLAIPRVLAGA